MPAGVQHRRAGGLEDAEVGRRGRQHRGDVDREQDRRRGADPGLVVEPERDEQHVAGEPLQRPGAELGARRRSRRAAGRGTRSARRARGSCARRIWREQRRAARPKRDAGAPWRSSSGASSTSDQQRQRRDRGEQQRVLVAAEEVDRGEHDRAEDRSARGCSAASGRRACPSTTGRFSRGRPVRRATTSAREGSPRRAGSVEDISTPMNVPCMASDSRIAGAWAARPGGSRARRRRASPSRRT